MFNFYHSDSVWSNEHCRVLLLRMVSEGMQTREDLELVLQNGMPSLIMALLMSPTITLQLQVNLFLTRKISEIYLFVAT